MYYTFLKEEFNKSGDIKALTTEQLKILKTIKESTKSNKIINLEIVDSFEDPHNNLPPEKDNEQVQKTLVKEIHLEVGQLINLLKPCGKLLLENIEHPCGGDLGFVDMLYKDDKTAYPLEVKVNEGKHDLLGQILKYERFFQFQLHLKLFEKVQPVTLCSFYNDFTLKELKKRGVITLKYERVSGKLKLYRI
jgi:hypothetical protein